MSIMSERYSRQMLFSPIGKEGQDKIRSKHVLMIGAGALGSGNAEMLTRAGVGELRLLIEIMLKQVIFSVSSSIQKKMWNKSFLRRRLLKNVLKEINSDVKIHSIIGDATPVMLEDLVQGIDLIIDSTDNFETRIAINDISQKFKIPWIYGACVGSYGMSFTIIPGKTPCLKLFIKNHSDAEGLTCDTGGIISPAVGMVLPIKLQRHSKCLLRIGMPFELLLSALTYGEINIQV